jgi:hypothetical protein
MLKVTAALKAELYPFYAPHAAASHARRLAKGRGGGAAGAGGEGAAAGEGEGEGVPPVVVSVHGSSVSVPPSAFLRDRADFKAAGAKLRQRIKDKLCPRDPASGQRTAPRRYSRTSTGGYIRKYVAAYMASRAAAKASRAGGAAAAGSAQAPQAGAGLDAGGGTAAGEGAEAGEGDAAGMEAPQAKEEGAAADGADAEAEAPGSDSESDGGEGEGAGSDAASDAGAEAEAEGRGAMATASGADDVLADIFEPEATRRSETGSGAAAEGPAS